MNRQFFIFLTVLYFGILLMPEVLLGQSKDTSLISKSPPITFQVDSLPVFSYPLNRRPKQAPRNLLRNHQLLKPDSTSRKMVITDNWQGHQQQIFIKKRSLLKDVLETKGKIKE